MINKYIYNLSLFSWCLVSSAIAGNYEEGKSALDKSDYIVAHEKFLNAAKEKNALAQYELGTMYWIGNGVSRNPHKAAQWYTLAAEGGVAAAKSQLELLKRIGYSTSSASDNVNLTGKLGTFTIEPIFDAASKFSEGLACVAFGEIEINEDKSGKFRVGFIDKKGNLVINPEFSTCSDFEDGIAVVKNANKDLVQEIYINKSGEKIFSREYVTLKDEKTGERTGYYFDTGGFKEGMLSVYQNDEYNFKFGFVDQSGTVVIPYKYEDSGSFSDGLARVGLGKYNIDPKLSNRKYGFINKQGRVVIDFKYELAGDFADGVATIKIRQGWFDGRYGLINKYGIEIIKPVYLNPLNFSEGLAPACIGDQLLDKSVRCGVINKLGKFIIPPTFSYDSPLLPLTILNFHEGLARFFENVNGNKKYGFIDKNGKKVISAKFDWVDDFSDGLAVVNVKINDKNLYGYINKKGAFVIEPKFDDARSFSEQRAVVRVNNKWGYISRN